MKISSILIPLSIALFSIYLNSFSSSARVLYPVLDSDGNPVIPGESYLMQKIVQTENGNVVDGDISLGKYNEFPCPLNVVFNKRYYRQISPNHPNFPLALPVTFLVLDTSPRVVYEGADVKIKTEFNSPCRNVWEVYDDGYIRTGYAAIRPPLAWRESLFFIFPADHSKPYDRLYKIGNRRNVVNVDERNNSLYVQRRFTPWKEDPMFQFVKYTPVNQV